MTTIPITHDENHMRYSYFENGLEAYLTYERRGPGCAISRTRSCRENWVDAALAKIW